MVADTARTTPLSLTLADASALIAGADVTRDATVREALAYVVDGDVWQTGRAWVGPRPTGNNPADALISAEIERGLAAANMARELVDRHVDGVIGREPDWTLPNLADADAEALTQWWDRQGVLNTLHDALRRALCGETPVLRLLIPAPPLGRPTTLADALGHIAVERLGSDTARVVDDPAAGLHLGAAVFDPDARTLDGLLGRGMYRRVAEIVSVDGEDTILRIVGDTYGAEPTTQAGAALPLGGRLTMHGLSVDPLLTPSLLGLQRHLTLTLSAMGRNTQAAGFVERVMLNAARPVDADGAALPYQAGAGMVNWLVGIQLADGYASPSMFVREPTSPEAFTRTAAELVFHAHKEARQLHALLAGDAAPSGESRRQAAADFLASLGPTARATERAVRWLLETAYALALHLRGQRIAPGVRAAVTMTLSAGVATVEEVKEAREGVAAKLLRRSRYQTAYGVDDSEAEEEAIDEEREAAMERAPAALTQARPDAMPAQASPFGEGDEDG